MKEKIKSFISRTVDVDLGHMEPQEDPDEKRKRRRASNAVLAGLIVLALYTGGCLGVIVDPGEAGWDFGFLHAVRTVFTTKAGAKCFAFILVVLLVLFVCLLFAGRRRADEDDRGFFMSRRGTYGTSSLEPVSEYRKYLTLTESAEETDGIILGRTLDRKWVVSLPRDNPLNRNMAVCGSQGSAKSVAFARNIIIQCAVRGESILCTDPKSELYGDTAYYLRQKGYEVYQWNLVSRWNSNGLDILQQVNGDEELEYVDVLCHTIIMNTLDGDDPDHFFDGIEEVLLKALVIYVIKEMPEDMRKLSEVYRMLLVNDANALDAKFSSLPIDHPAKGPYNLFSQSPSNKGNAILGLGARLKNFQNEAVCGMSGADEIDLEGIAKRKTAVFCIVSDRDSTYNMLNALFISLVFIKIMAYADRQPRRKCDVPVQILLDELPNIGIIDDLKKKEGTARSRDIGMTLMFQNIPQMENRFPNDGYLELLGGCDFNLYLGCNETTTSKYYSELTGTSTIQVETVRKNLNTIRVTDYTHQIASSQGEGQRATVMEDEVRRLELDELLLFIHGKKPIKLKKFNYYEHPEALLMRPVQSTEVRPPWRVQGDVDMRTKKAPDGREKDFDSLCRDIRDFVVMDTEKYGPQRTKLLKEYKKLRQKYGDTFPNGMAAFDDGIKGAARQHADVPREAQPQAAVTPEGCDFDAAKYLGEQPGQAPVQDTGTVQPVQQTEPPQPVQQTEPPQAGQWTAPQYTDPQPGQYMGTVQQPEPVQDPGQPGQGTDDGTPGDSAEGDWKSMQIDDLVESLKMF